jgi:anti-sigma B factor antagonist
MSQIKIEEQIGGVIVTPKGQFIGGEETDELRNALQNIAEQKKNNLVIDLKSVTYLNSTALGVLISAHTNFVKRNGKVILCNVGKSLESIFMITKLTMVFPISENLESAIKEIS